METHYLLLPMLAQVALTGYAIIVMRLRREWAVREEGLNPLYFKTKQVGEPPRKMKQADDLVDNLFQTPLIFFAGCLAAMSLNLVDEILVGLASLYVVFRIAHAHQILGPNKIMRRSKLWISSNITTGIIWLWLTKLAFL